MTNDALPRHVLHVMNSSAGGAALSTLDVIKGLRERGVRSSVLCHGSAHGKEAEALMEATQGRALFRHLYWWNKKTRAKLWKRPALEALQLWQTGASWRSTLDGLLLARSAGIDLVHSNTVLTLEGARTARVLGLPHVWHVRELIGKNRIIELPLHDRRLGRYLERHASVVVANSGATAACLAPWMRPELLRVVPNGLDLKGFDAPPHARAKPIVGMVANLTSQWKKHALFVEAAARVQAPAEFRIYGYDPAASREPGHAYARDVHRRATDLGLGDRLRFMGHAPPRAIMAELDLLVHPADKESFGRVVVEAMAAGLPVVGTRGGGVAEIVVHEQTGLLAPCDRPDELARLIDELLASPDRRQSYGRAGRVRAQKKYSLDACVMGILESYRVALQRPLRLLPRF